MDKSGDQQVRKTRRNRRPKKSASAKAAAKIIDRAADKLEKRAEQKVARRQYPLVAVRDDVNLQKARKALVKQAGPGAKDVLDVFNTIVMPGVGKNVRIGEEFGSRPTGVASLFNRFDTSFSLTAGKTGQCFLFKSALRYQMEAYSNADYYAEGPTDYNGEQEISVSSAGAVAYFNTALTAPLAGVHGPMIYPGRLGPSDPNYGYIGNKGDNFRVDAPTSASTTVYNITINRFTVRDWQPVETKAAVGGHPVNFTIPEFGYYSFAITTPTISASPSFHDRFTLVLSCGVGAPDPSDLTVYWGQTSLPALEDNIATVQNIKFHGLSLMWTNTSNMLSKQGQIAMMQIPANSWFGNYVGYSNVATKNVRVEANLDAQEGAYLFQKPAGIEDFTWTNEIVPDPATPEGVPPPRLFNFLNAWFYLLPQTDFITIALDIPVWGTGVDSRAGYWTARTDIEYASVDQWRSLQHPTIRKESLEKALALVSAAPQFHTNEFHLSDLWEWVKGAAKTVANAIVDYGPTVLKAAAFVAPLLI